MKKLPKCLNCGGKLKPVIYRKKDGFPKLVGKPDGHTFWCPKCDPKHKLNISIG